jgi:hypothetical protein
MKTFLLSALWLGLVGLLASCSSNTNATVGLRLELESIERDGNGGATATVRIVNPNLVAYNIDRATHRVFLGERLVGTLEVKRPLGIPAQNVGRHTGALTMDKSATLAVGSASYRLESKVVLRLYGERTEDAKLSGSGTVTVK